MIVLTSAKSRLMTPGTVIRSVIPWVPWDRTPSAVVKASSMVVFFSAMSSRRSFGMTIMVSTDSASVLIPSSAEFLRLRPSKVNGLVTTATVSAPTSFIAMSATMGAAPVPVPPPSPQVMNTMSAPASASAISSRLSSAALRPTSGLAPAPRPRVMSVPMWTLMSASEMARAWASVLMATNSTPRIPSSIMRFTAFVPPPPTPTTLMTAR
ncbi:Uncharacterised protein [Collinsella intestinalis]|nr:Uncharacterised protein [Collinsella intestinalis]